MLFISTFSHKHGTSVCLIEASSLTVAYEIAGPHWIEADGMEADEKERDEIGESYEVYVAPKPVTKA